MHEQESRNQVLFPPVNKATDVFTFIKKDIKQDFYLFVVALY